MERSKDPGSKPQGGDLGWFDPSGMVPEFGAAVSKLEKGKFTQEPVKTQFGYHVILLEDIEADRRASAGRRQAAAHSTAAAAKR